MYQKITYYSRISQTLHVPVPAASGGPSFPSLTSLIARWRADMGVTAPGGNITEVLDQSGNGNTLVNGGGNVPLNATGYNGKPAFGFIAANAGYLICNPINLTLFNTTDVTVYCIGQMIVEATYGGCSCYGNTTNNDYDTTGAFAVTRDDNAANFLLTAAPDGSTVQAMSGSANHRWGMRYSLDGGKLNHDTILDGTINVVTKFTGGTLIANGQFVMGARIITGAPSTPFWDGPIAEMVVCNAILSPAEVTALDNYFVAQWGA